LSVEGYSEDAGGKRTRELHVTKGVMRNATEHPYDWDKRFIESFIEIIPEEMYYTSRYKDENAGSSHIVFFLSDNEMFCPLRIDLNSPNVEVLPVVVLDIADGWSAKFEEHYRYINAEIENVTGSFSTGHLVLTLKKDNYQLSSIDGVKTISDLITTLLWYLSFACRQRTTWIKWGAVVENNYVQYYRRISIPERTGMDPLIEENFVQKFLQHCLEYINNENNLNLYLPIILLVNSYNPKETLESQFLSLSMALEALLNSYAKNQDKTKYIKDKELWQNYKAHMMEAIRKFPNMSNNDRDVMRGKALDNRPPIRLLYDDFCRETGVINFDLWPVYGRSKCFPLYQIRNNLIHGTPFESESFLVVARHHLQWTVERCLLAILEWGEPTNVKSDFLSKYHPAYHNWRQHYKKESG